MEEDNAQPSDKRVPVTVRLSTADIEKVDKIGDQTGATRSGVLRFLVRQCPGAIELRPGGDRK